MVVRSYEEECGYLERLTSHSWRIKKGFQPNMNVEGIFYVNDKLEKLMFDELKNACRPGKVNQNDKQRFYFYFVKIHFYSKIHSF